MTTSAPPRSDYHNLDGLIERALAELRMTRVAYRRSATAQNLERRDRAAAQLDALLDDRLAAMSRDRT